MKVPFAEKVGYSLGDGAANLVFQLMMMFQLMFYTDVLGIGAGAAGLILLGARVLDAFIDPLAGILSDRTHTKWGKYRPWVVGTAIPFAVVFALSYLSPDWGVRAKTAWAAGTYALLMALYSFNNTPYSSLGGVMTDEGRERTSVATVRFVAATIATIVVQVATLPLVERFDDPKTGWGVTVGIYAVFAAVMLLVSGFVAKERIAPPATQRKSLGEDMKSVLGDAPWRAMFVLTLFLFVTLALWGSASAYYFKYAVSEETLGFPLFNGVGQGITFVAVVTLPRLPGAHGRLHRRVLLRARDKSLRASRHGRAQVARLRAYDSASLGDDGRCGGPRRMGFWPSRDGLCLRGHRLRAEGGAWPRRRRVRLDSRRGRL